MDRQKLAERLEDMIVDIIENDEMDDFRDYLLSVSNLIFEYDIGHLSEIEFAFSMEELKLKFMNYKGVI